MYMVLFKPSWPFLRGNFGDKLLLDMYIIPLATCYHWNQRGKVILFLCYKQDTLLKKKKKVWRGTKEKGNCGLASEDALPLLLAGETFLGTALAPLNTIETSWGRWVLTVGIWDAGRLALVFSGLHVHQNWGVLLHVDANPSSDTVHLCAFLCGGLAQQAVQLCPVN